MNRNLNKIITVKRYFEIIAMTDLSPLEIVKIKSFEKFIKLATSPELERFISPTTQEIVNEYYKGLLELSGKANKSAQEEKVLQEFESALPNTSEESLENDGPILKLTKKAGYVDATIILVILLNIGFIVAITMIGR